MKKTANNTFEQDFKELTTRLHELGMTEFESICERLIAENKLMSYDTKRQMQLILDQARVEFNRRFTEDVN